MELIYLWIEDYKNIKKQGFNFSPKFYCNFDGETLTIKENIDKKGKKQYIKNFFGDNINVTAIVGKNGSGKSNIAECIAFNHFIKLGNDKFILFLYYDKVNNSFFKYLGKTKKIVIKPEKIKVDDLDNIFKIFYTSGRTWFDPINERDIENSNKIVYETDMSDYTLFEWYAQQIQNDYGHKLQSFKQIWFFSRTQNTLNGLKLFKSQIKFPKDLVKPKSVYINLDASFVKINYANFIQNKFGDNYIGVLDDLVGLANNPHNQTIQENEYKLKHILLQNLISIMKLEENDIKINFEKLSFNEYRNKDIEWHKKKIDEGWNSIKEKSELKEYRLDRLIELLSEKEKFDIEKDFEDIQEILDIYRIFLGYGKIDFLELRYEPFLSSGGEQIINVIARMYIQIEKKIKIEPTNKFILLVLDEPDIYLHPNWQKQFINILISFLEKNYKEIDFHLIFTTHSPFLLSDIPKKNIIFLDTYKKNEEQKEGNCKVLNHDEVLSHEEQKKEQTFGANIHTLLSDSFFMEDGLMGEFAKSKIMQIKKFHKKILKYKENKKVKKAYKWIYLKKRKKFWQIQSIIGEPFLKIVIKNYLDEVENILFDDAKAKKMAIKRFIDEYGIDDINQVMKHD